MMMIVWARFMVVQQMISVSDVLLLVEIELNGSPILLYSHSIRLAFYEGIAMINLLILFQLLMIMK